MGAAMSSYHYQNGALHVGLLDFISKFSTFRTLCQQHIGNPISNFIQNADNELTQWFWQGIGALPKNYFSKDVTEIDYFDSPLWEGIFNDRLELLKDQLISELAKNQQFSQSQNTSNIVSAEVDKLKEQIGPVLPSNGRLPFEEQLYQLQGLIGKYMLSPQAYEQGLESLKAIVSDNKLYTTLIEKARSSFRAELRRQPELLAECLQGEILAAFKVLSWRSLTLASLRNILSYYKPLMKHKVYARHQSWLQECYNTQSLLLPPVINISLCKQYSKEVLANTSLSNYFKQNHLNCQGVISNWGKLFLEHAGKLVILGLVVQVSAAQASVTNTTQKYLILRENSTSTFLLHPKHLSTMQPKFKEEVVTLPINITNSDKNITSSREKGIVTALYTFNNKLTTKLPTNATITEDKRNEYCIEISKESRQEILSQFDKIISDLREFTEIFSLDEEESLNQQSNQTVLTRVPRSSPLGRRTQCTVSQDKLTGLKDEINNALSNISEARDSNCEPNSGNPNNCNELIKLIQCGINHLTNGFLKATANQGSLDELTKWKHAYGNLFETHRKEIDDVRQSVSREDQQKIDLLKTDLNMLKLYLDRTLDELTKQIIKSCISEIASGKTESAIKDFKRLQDNSELSKIIRSAYSGYDKLNQVKNIVNFIRNLPNCNQDRIAYQALFDVMKENFHLDSPEVLLIFSAVNHSNTVNGCMVSSSVENELKTSVSEIVDAWAYKIRKDDYEQVIEIVKKDCSTYVNDYWSKIIEKAYAYNLDNAENILKFIRSLPCINQTARSVSALFDQMKDNNDLNSYQLLMLAYKIKQELDFVDNNSNFQYGTGGHKYYADLYDNLKDDLPSSVRGLIWDGSSCSIKNDVFADYLYAAGDYFAYDSDRRRVFGWRKVGNVIQGYWSFEAEDNAKSFTIKNTHFGEYLYAADNGHEYDSTRRRIFTWKPKSKVVQGYWTLIPVDVHRSEFRIKNTHYTSCGEHLYASESDYAYDSDRRRVFTWQGCGTIEYNKDVWEIECN